MFKGHTCLFGTVYLYPFPNLSVPSSTCNITLGSLAICEMSCSLFFFFFQVLNLCFVVIHSGHFFFKQ